MPSKTSLDLSSNCFSLCFLQNEWRLPWFTWHGGFHSIRQIPISCLLIFPNGPVPANRWNRHVRYDDIPSVSAVKSFYQPCCSITLKTLSIANWNKSTALWTMVLPAICLYKLAAMQIISIGKIPAANGLIHSARYDKFIRNWIHFHHVLPNASIARLSRRGGLPAACTRNRFDDQM